MQPVAVSTNQPGDSFPVGNLINQSGLSASYVSGVTDFDSFVATTTGFNGSSGVGGASSAPPVNFDFDMGSTVNVDSIAVWNQGGSASLVNFNLLADDSASFSSATLLGSFTMTTFSTSLASVFNFTTTSARFFRIAATSNQGFGSATRFDEMALRQASSVSSPVPEPSSLCLILTSLLLAASLRMKNLL